jgi:hypothetical protein
MQMDKVEDLQALRKIACALVPYVIIEMRGRRITYLRVNMRG